MENYIKSLTEYYYQERSKRLISDTELISFYNGWKQQLPEVIDFESSCVLLKYLQDLAATPDELCNIICTKS